MSYALVKDGAVDKFPYALSQLRKDNPKTSFPKQMSESLLAEFGVYPVNYGPLPEVDSRTHKVVEAAVPELVDGVWTIVFTAQEKTPDEVNDYAAMVAKSVRGRRQSELAATDYLALSDSTLSTEMAAYRQALRDIPAHPNFPFLEDSDWPAKPV